MRAALLSATLACAGLSVLASDTARGLKVREIVGADAPVPAYHALVIGINRYSNWQDLRNARRDAEELATLLQDRYGFRDVQTLYDGDATLKAIKRSLRNYARRLTPADALLIFYAGHGHFDKILNQGFWIPGEAREHDAEGEPAVADWLSDKELVDVYVNAIKARHVLIVTDSCFGGALFRSGAIDLTAKANAYYRRALEAPSRWAMTSGDLEMVPDESVFTRKLLNKLRAPPKPVFSTTDVFAWIREEVASDAGCKPFAGRLNLRGDDLAGEFVFMVANAGEIQFIPEALAPPPATDASAAPYTGALVVESPLPGNAQIDGGKVYAISPGRGLTWDALAVGLHEVQVSADGQSWRKTVTIRRDETATARAVFGPMPGQNCAVDLGGGVELELVWIEPGSFLRNSPDSKDGKPQYRVTLSKGFWMGRYEVTQEQWERVMGSNPSNFKSAGPKAPVENVSWNDCQAFIKKLNARVSVATFRLPTEAEWEYACRAGTPTRFCNGDSEAELDRVAWYDSNSGDATHPVGQKQPNAWGLCDMHGNVSEWCQDGYSGYPRGPVTDPVGRPSSGFLHVTRGGSWNAQPRICGSAARMDGPTKVGFNYSGFRVVGLR